MAFQVSPGVNVSEVDLSTVVPAVSTTEGAIAGVFKWGPVDTRVLIDSEESLVARFYKPDGSLNPETFFTAANFLAYGNKLFVNRVVDANSRNAVSNGSSAGILIKNEDFIDDTSITSNDHFIARFPGALGNSLQVSACKSANDYLESSTGTLTIVAGNNIATTSQNETTSGGTSLAQVGDKIKFGNSTVGVFYLEIEAANSTTFTFTENYTGSNTLTDVAFDRYWKYYDLVRAAPGTSTFVDEKGGAGDEIHIVVADEDGDITGTKGTVLEVYEGVSRATDAKTESGETNFFIDVIKQRSSWIYAKGATNLVTTNTAVNMAALTTDNATYDSLKLGNDSLSESQIELSDLV